MDVGAALRLSANLPQLDTSATVLTNVNRDCDAVGVNDFESFGGAFLVGAGLELSTVASFILEEGKFETQDIPDHWDLSLWSRDFPLAPTRGVNTSTCFVLSDDNLTPNGTDTTEPQSSSGSHTSSAQTSSTPASSSSLPGVPASTGTLYPAASAVPTWNFTKIASYYSASSQLPTNVNYTQMVQATTVPDNLKPAVSNAVKSQKKSGAMSQAKATWQVLLVAAAFFAACSWM